MNRIPFPVGLFVKGDDYNDAFTRKKCGTVSGCVGICSNALLFFAKLFAGYVSGSIAVVSDAFNNLSDAASSAVTLFGFRMAGKPPDEGHPFGHSRIEYLSGMIISLAILLMGFELGKSSIEKIFAPEPVTLNPVALVILFASVAVKFWMYRFNKRLGRAMCSEAIAATARDSLTDSVATLTVAVGTIAGHFAKLPLDGWLGALVAVFILYSGITTLKQTVDPLIGTAAPESCIQEIRALALSDCRILGVHDVVVHSYGPGRYMISLHAELPQSAALIDAHDAADAAERRIAEKYGPSVVIHVDPVSDNDDETAMLRREMSGILAGIDKRLNMHDFRVTGAKGAQRLVFDVDVPSGEPTDGAVLCRTLQSCADERFGTGFYTVCAYIDKGYLSKRA